MKFILSYSQNAEDVVLRRIFKYKQKGFYIDVGAGYPIINSVTKHFYENGWRGINIEPQKDIFKVLEKARPEDVNLNVAIDTESGKKKMAAYPDRWGLATLDRSVMQHHKELGLREIDIDVDTTTIDSILDKYNIDSVDFFKVDVEGFEDQVIQTIDFSKIQPSVIVVEATYPAESKLAIGSWHKVLLKNGYDYVLFDGINNFYVTNDIAKTIDGLLPPANHRDRFIPLEQWRYLSKENRQRWMSDRELEGHDISDIERYESQQKVISAEYEHMLSRSSCET